QKRKTLRFYLSESCCQHSGSCLRIGLSHRRCDSSNVSAKSAIHVRRLRASRACNVSPSKLIVLMSAGATKSFSELALMTAYPWASILLVGNKYTPQRAQK